jgi:hypothetical protein
MFQPGDRCRAWVNEDHKGDYRCVELIRPWEWPGKSLWLVRFVDEKWKGTLLYDEDKMEKICAEG